MGSLPEVDPVPKPNVRRHRSNRFGTANHTTVSILEGSYSALAELAENDFRSLSAEVAWLIHAEQKRRQECSHE